MTFDDLVAPLGEARFLAEHYGTRPAHLPASDRRGTLGIGWDRMNQLLAIAPHWTQGNLKLVLNSRPVDPAFYMDEVETFDGTVRRADPAKIDVFLGMGASLVANDAQAIAPEIRGVADLLSARFTAPAAANIYCSFDAVQAFDTHYDTHEVFALQCAGEKVWRLYANRAADAADPPPPGPDAQARINAARGPLAMEVRTRPGDLLYIPRGVYHDALARDGASLHVTFAVAPRLGRLVGRLLPDFLQHDPAFAAYLPAPDEEDGEALRRHLDALATRVGALIRSPAFATALTHAQRRGAAARHTTSLPERPRTEYHARTDRPAELRRSDAGLTLVAAGRATPLGDLDEAATWALSRPAFSILELGARFGHLPAPRRAALVELLTSAGLIRRYDPTL